MTFPFLVLLPGIAFEDDVINNISQNTDNISTQTQVVRTLQNIYMYCTYEFADLPGRPEGQKLIYNVRSHDPFS